MNYKITLYIGIVMILVSIFLIGISLLNSNYFFVIIGILFLLVSIFLVFFSSTMELYKQDKILDFDVLEKQGLTVVECPKCYKKNVLEDQYCIFCGEKLGEDDENSL